MKQKEMTLFIQILSKYFWSSIVALGLGICVVLIPYLFNDTIDIVNAGDGSEGSPYTVCASGCDYTNVQGAIDSAGAGAFISVQPTYNPAGEGNIDFDIADGMTLDCNSSGAVIGVDGGVKVINLLTDNITIKNCTLNNLYLNDTGNSLLGFSLQNNTFASSSATSDVSFTTAGTTNPSITSNTGDFRVAMGNITGGTISNNTFTNYNLGTNDRAIQVEGNGFTISGNTFYMYTGVDNHFIGNDPSSGGIENSTIANNTMQYVTTVATMSNGGLKAISFSDATSTSITSNYILMPGVEGVIDVDAIYLGKFQGNTSLSDITVSNNTIKLMSSGTAIKLPNIGGTPDIDITYNLLYSGTTAIGTGLNCSNTITTTSLSFDYNGFYNLVSNISSPSPCISSIGANSKTTNPYLKTDDVDTSNDRQPAPFSQHLDVNGTTDIGAYSAERGNSFVIDPSGIINYSTVHATTTGILALAKNGDTFALAAGTYDPLSFSSLSSFTLDGSGVGTIIQGGTTSSSLLLTNIADSTFQDFVVQNASSTVSSYTATQMIFDYNGDTYGDTSVIESPGDNYTELFSSADGCAMEVEWGADGYDVTGYVSDDWNLWLFSALGGKFTALVPDQFYTSASAVETACAELSPTTDAWVDDIFQYSGGTMTYNSSAVAVAGVTLTSGMTNPPAITRTESGYAGIKFAGTSSGNTVSNVTSTANGYGFWFSGTSATNNVNDSITSNSVVYDLYSDTTGTNNIKNTSFIVASSTVSGGGQMNVYEKFRAYVIDESNTPLSGVTVYATSTDGSVLATLTTDSSGYTSYTDYLLAFILNDSSPITTQGGYNPFSFRAVKNGYDDKVQNATINSQNQTVSISMDDNPSDPTNVIATTTAATSIIVQWTDNSSNESNFIFDYIQGSSDLGFPGTTSTVSALSGTGALTTTISSLTPNTAYMARVQAVGTAGSSSYTTSSVMYTNPNIPASVVATPNGQNSILVSWGADSNASDTVYEVYNVTASTVITSSTTSTTYIVTSLAANSEYEFKVRSQYASSSTLWSNYSDTSTTSTDRVAISAEVTVNVGQSVGFELTAGGSHTGTLNSIIDGVASLTVASTPTTVSLTQGSTAYIDSSGDGVNDISVTATSVGSSSAIFALADYTPTASSEDVSSGGGGGGSILSKAVSLTGIVVNGVIRAVTSIPSVFISFLGIEDTATEYVLSFSASFSGSSWQPLSQKTVSYELPAEEGIYTIYGKVRSVNGDSSVVRSAQVTYNKDAPVNPPILLVPEENEVITRLPFVASGKALPFGIVDIMIGGSTYTITADEFGEFTTTILDQLVNGDYKIEIRQTDGGGSSSPSVIRNISIVQRAARNKPQTTDSTTDVTSGNTTSGTSVPGESLSNTTETVKETVDNIQSGNQAYLLVTQSNSSFFERHQVGTVTAASGDTLEILLRPALPVHSVTARLYTMIDSPVPLSLFDGMPEFKKVLGEKIYAVAASAWVNGFLFERQEQVDAYKGLVHLNVPHGTYKLVVTLNGQDGSRTHITKQVEIEKKGMILSRDGESISDGFIKIFVEKQNSYVPWDADNFGQQNPLPLDAQGQYAFSVPPGNYYLEVSALGYKNARTPILQYNEPSILSQDIVLDPSRSNMWTKFWGWVRSVVK